MLPFTVDQFFQVFADYNAAIWPAQPVAFVLGVVALWLVYGHYDRLVAAILALMWAWTGIAYHVMHFSSINAAGYLFGAIFALQAMIFAFYGIVSPRLHFGWRGDAWAYAGGLFVAYALLIYPLIGLALGHTLGELPAFGVTPCPVTIFSFGVLLLTTSRVPVAVQVIPFLWSLVGGSAAFLLNVPQDLVLLASGFVASGLLLVRDRL